LHFLRGSQFPQSFLSLKYLPCHCIFMMRLTVSLCCISYTSTTTTAKKQLERNKE
jgi:hypothetical protein